jgi:hypothetical protein
MNGNMLVAVESDAATEVREYVRDTTPPVLERFDFNLTSEVLTLSFSETVQESTLSIEALTFSNSTSAYTLTNVSSPASSNINSVSLQINLGRVDLNRIKFLRMLAVDPASTFLQIEAELVQDIDNNAVTPISSPGLAVQSFFEDKVPPELEAFDLDLSTGLLKMYFSETIETDTLVSMANLNLRTNESDASGIDLSVDTTLITNQDSHILLLQIGVNDANELKLHPTVARDSATSWLAVKFGTVHDMNENEVLSTVLNVGNFTPDKIAPVPIAFTANLDLQQLYIEFDETVEVTSLVSQRLTLQSNEAADVFYVLKGGHSFGPSGTNISVQLAKTDVDEINLRAMFTQVSDSTLNLSTGALQDTSVHKTDSVAKTLNASAFIRDSTPPKLTNFSFNLTSHQMVLVFDEVVRTRTLDPTAITFQSQGKLGDSGETHTLSKADVETENGLVHRLNLSTYDINEIKKLENLLVDPTAAFLTCTEKLVQDMAGNNVTAITSDSALLSSAFVDDSRRPKLLSFNLNMDSQVLTLNFSEVVDADKTATSAITLQKVATATNALEESVTLSEASFVTTVHNGLSVSINISNDDMDLLRSRKVAMDNSSVYLVSTSNLIVDMNSLAVMAVSAPTPMTVTEYVTDSTPPTLLLSSLDMDAATITLSFSETIDASTLKVQHLTVQEYANSSGSSYTLRHTSGADAMGAADTPNVTFTVDIEDMNAIKELAAFGLAVSKESTYFSITDAFITDVFGLPVVPITDEDAQGAFAYGRDITGPTLERFDLNLDDYITVDRINVASISISLTFKETIKFESYVASELTLQSSSNASGNAEVTVTSVQLSGYFNNITTENGLRVSFRLLHEDANKIKLIESLAIEKSDTFVSLSEGFITDMYDNQLQVVSPESAMQVTTLVKDEVGPQFLRFSIDMNAGTVTVLFDETVKGLSIKPNELTIRDTSDPEMQTVNYTLTGAIGQNDEVWVPNYENTTIRTYSHDDSTEIVIKFTKTDLDEIKRLNLCTHTTRGIVAEGGEDCFVVHTEFFVYDMFGNDVTRCT